MIYRFDIRYPANRGGVGSKFRLMITADSGNSVNAVNITFVTDKPTMRDLREHLAAKGFEAYGDMVQIGGSTIRSMVRPVA